MIEDEEPRGAGVVLLWPGPVGRGGNTDQPGRSRDLTLLLSLAQKGWQNELEECLKESSSLKICSAFQMSEAAISRAMHGQPFDPLQYLGRRLCRTSPPSPFLAGRDRQSPSNTLRDHGKVLKDLWCCKTSCCRTCKT